MKAVILVGGEGTRLRPLTVNVPKPMLPVINRPFLELVFSYLKSQGISDVILSMGYRSDVIERHFGDGTGYGVNLKFVVESSPLGTAGGVKNVEQFIDGPFFVFNGDILTDLDLVAMLEAHRERQAKATIALTPVEDPTAYGLVETDGDGRVRRFLEKPKPEEITTNLINAGTYILEPEVLDLIPSGSYHMFERGVFPELLRRGDPLFGYASDCYWIDIGTPVKYRAVHRDILEGRVKRWNGAVTLHSGVRVGKDVSIAPTAKVSGSVVLGDRVCIEAGACVEGPTTIGTGSTIGANSTVSGAILWNNVRIGRDVKLDDCIVGNEAIVEDGSSIAGGSIVSDQCVIGTENRLDRAIRVWPGCVLGARAISF